MGECGFFFFFLLVHIGPEWVGLLELWTLETLPNCQHANSAHLHPGLSFHISTPAVTSNNAMTVCVFLLALAHTTGLGMAILMWVYYEYSLPLSGRESR